MCYTPSNPPVDSIPALIKSKRKERGLTQRALGATPAAPPQRKRRCSRWLLIVSICEPAYLHGFVTARRFRAAGDRDART